MNTVFVVPKNQLCHDKYTLDYLYFLISKWAEQENETPENVKKTLMSLAVDRNYISYTDDGTATELEKLTKKKLFIFMDFSVYLMKKIGHDIPEKMEDEIFDIDWDDTTFYVDFQN